MSTPCPKCKNIWGLKGTSEFRDETETRILRAKVTKVGGEAPRPKPSMVPGPPVPAPPAWMN